MLQAKLSSKFQLSIPKALRHDLNLQADQQFTLIARGTIIELSPVRSIENAKGMLSSPTPLKTRRNIESERRGMCNAADFSAELKLSFADAIIYATAWFYQVELVTFDNHFKDLPAVTCFAKP